MAQTPTGTRPQDEDYSLKHNSGTQIGGLMTPQQRRTSRNRKIIIAGTAVFTLGVIGALAGVLIAKPWNHNHNHDYQDSASDRQGSENAETNHGKPPNNNHLPHSPPQENNHTQTPKSSTIERFTASSSVSISSAVRCNEHTPPLDQPFLYGQQPIRGVNLGGWLVLEPFITPSIFEPYIPQNVTDEYSLTKLLGPEKAKAVLQEHYSKWVTEDTFKRIRDLGLNHVRIPVGFWALGDLEPDEPYVPDLSLDYLLQGLKWAAQYGIRVIVELHAAPGSQNGWNHSGRAGKIGWLDGTAQGEKNAARTIEYMKKLLTLLKDPGMVHVSPMYGILNEPAIFMLDSVRVKAWYGEAYAALRNITGPGQGPWAVLHDGFLGMQAWEGFMPNSDRLAL
ncbi:hypothetical protein BGZ49_003417, partial [Haplosporangium sp. Z 27]